jgi:hypothetical protein
LFNAGNGTQIAEYQRVFFVLNELSKIITDDPDIGALEDITSWAVLYRILCRNSGFEDSMLKPKMMPRNFNDLVFRVKVMLNGASRLRLGVSEGQKRTYSCLHWLLGLRPRVDVEYHGKLNSVDYLLPSADFSGSGKVSLEKMQEKINPCLKKLTKIVVPKMIQVLSESEGLVEVVLKTIRAQSLRSARSATTAQNVGWRAVVLGMCRDLRDPMILVPFECRPGWNKKFKENDWMLRYRKKIGRNIIV